MTSSRAAGVRPYRSNNASYYAITGVVIASLQLYHAISQKRYKIAPKLLQQESPADAGIPARRKNDEKKSWEMKIPPFRSYNKFQSSRKSGVYSN